jgi:hypothetical protein
MDRILKKGNLRRNEQDGYYNIKLEQKTGKVAAMKTNINTTENYSSSKKCRGKVFQHIKILFFILKGGI